MYSEQLSTYITWSIITFWVLLFCFGAHLVSNCSPSEFQNCVSITVSIPLPVSDIVADIDGGMDCHFSFCNANVLYYVYHEL